MLNKLINAITVVCVVSAPCVPASSVFDATAGRVVSASSAGAHLDSDLLKGGGTDDTVILQGVLDRAAQGKPIALIVDGPALVSGLNVYGNTVIDCINGGGFFLKDGSSRALIRNAHRSRDAVLDRRITVRGCFMNGNRDKQPVADILRPDEPEEVQRAHPYPSNKEADGTYMAGLQFMGVEDLTLENLTMWHVRAFGALIANGERITIRDVTVEAGFDPGLSTNEYGNTDGLHFKGPLRYINIDGLRVHVGDDAIAFNADDYETDDLAKRNDFGPYIRSGPITDVTVANLQLMETSSGVRILSSKHRIDRIAVSNVSGVVKGYHVVDIGHWANRTSLGNVGTVSFSNLVVDSHMDPVVGAATSFLNIDGHIETLVLRNIVTTVGDARPILRFGPDADVKLTSVELQLHDPKQQAVPILLDAGSRVDVMSLLVDWQGGSANENCNPIVSKGGTIGELRWMGMAKARAGIKR